MNRLSREKQKCILSLLVEGSSLRSVSRIVDCSINTVTKFLIDMGKASLEYHDKIMRDLPCKALQVDEIWNFCYTKKKNIFKAKAAPKEAGDVWTWVAIDADTKLVPYWTLGRRTQRYATSFMLNLAERLRFDVHLSSDGLNMYFHAVNLAFNNNVHYAMIRKIFNKKTGHYEGYEIDKICGKPEDKKISTSIVERNNLTMRMGMRRYTRKTNGYTKKLENQGYALALHFLHYNFARVHHNLRVTPAMEAGLSDHIWTLDEMLDLAY